MSTHLPEWRNQCCIHLISHRNISPIVTKTVRYIPLYTSRQKEMRSVLESYNQIKIYWEKNLHKKTAL